MGITNQTTGATSYTAINQTNHNMKTALQQAIEQVQERGSIMSRGEALQILVALLPAEREQIEAAVSHGYQIGGENNSDSIIRIDPSDYFTNTFDQ